MARGLERRNGTLEAFEEQDADEPDDLFLSIDIELGQRCGATTFLVRTGDGQQTASAGTVAPDYVVADLAEAAEVIRRLLCGRENDRLSCRNPYGSV